MRIANVSENGLATPALALKSGMTMSDLTDFFIAGGTLRAQAPSYVTRPADQELFEHTLAGEFCYVLTPRQMGKSSLMIRTARRLNEAGIATVAILDLTGIGDTQADSGISACLHGSRRACSFRLTCGNGGRRAHPWPSHSASASFCATSSWKRLPARS